MRIIVTGATGLIGKKICEKLINKGEEVIVFSRSPNKAKSSIPYASDYVEWNYLNQSDNQWKEKLNSADSIIHLAGENVMARRWNKDHKDRVLNSRVLGTRSLIDAIESGNTKLTTFISASAVGYYGNSETKQFTEDSERGKDFLATVTGKWESEVIKASDKGLREARVRIGIVLDKNEGALAKMLTPFKLFVGGPLGSGKQWFPWIHVDDVVGIFLHALYNENINGALNAAAPEKINMKQFSDELGRVMNRPSFFPVPEFILKLILGEGAEVVTNGNNVLPVKTLNSGYEFNYKTVKESLSDLLN